MQRHYPEIALHVPTLLLPRPGLSLHAWSVIACDQYTSQPEYWEETQRLVGDAPSTLHLVLPEAHLGTDDREETIGRINHRMTRFLSDGTLVEHPPAFMLVEREVGRTAPRQGLLVALDLERFDFSEGARELIRSTEGTDPARLPARMAVRRHAPLEAPHILVLIDDPDGTVIEPLCNSNLPQAYDFELMQGGGRVRGRWVSDEKLIDATASRLRALVRGDPPMLYAMGDGNHSFAAARAIWEESKKREPAGADHPGRYALVELVNIHDPALCFEPIHRLVDSVDPQELLQAMIKDFRGQGVRHWTYPDEGIWRIVCAVEPASKAHRLPYRTATTFGVVEIETPALKLETATLHAFLDPYLDEHGAARVDYIHGEAALADLCRTEGRIGFVLPAMDKHDLFASVVEEGATPRKTFSLGEAHEKRFYLECRRIRR
ncbi:MAG: DUF1015 domain-containing protein [Gammaproteobacteria bacterium]|nr:DUF1015 domain-containing protein [Gammaproteobacteria bacterium]